ncbi:hypothetical protein [Alysiella crassa]|nr:hypothetical protein [Alysiella crassa]
MLNFAYKSVSGSLKQSFRQLLAHQNQIDGTTKAWATSAHSTLAH